MTSKPRRRLSDLFNRTRQNTYTNSDRILPLFRSLHSLNFLFINNFIFKYMDQFQSKLHQIFKLIEGKLRKNKTDQDEEIFSYIVLSPPFYLQIEFEQGEPVMLQGYSNSEKTNKHQECRILDFFQRLLAMFFDYTLLGLLFILLLYFTFPSSQNFENYSTISRYQTYDLNPQV